MCRTFSANRLRLRLARAGFTLIEIMVVVVIISVLAAVAVPALQKVQRKAKTTTIVNDFRVFTAAFDSYAQEMGAWPPEAAMPGFSPPGWMSESTRRLGRG
jgi:prepilin-type N-terminal cleavage/methylation domain-containing protein